MQEVNCPGKEAFLSDAEDLSPQIFRQLVARRARVLLDASLATPSDEDSRRSLEVKIEDHFEKIHKGKDFLPARFLADGAKRSAAVCRIATRNSLGTGFLIAPGIVMTNNHVLGSEGEASESVAEFGLEDGKSPIVVSIQPDRLFITDAELDFTIVACDGGPLSGIEPIPLLRNPAVATRNERVNVIQHPRGRNKEVAIHDNRIVRVQNLVIKYTTDTEPGSSGSPVFNNAWDLVALHHAGVSQPNGAAENEGIRISAIVAHLVNRQNEGFHQPEELESLLSSVTDSSPYLGFFDTRGLSEFGSQEVEVPDFQGTDEFADVGVWNIEHFNDGVSSSRVKAVADVVHRLSLDVLGLTEVQERALDRLVAEVGTRGSHLDYEILDVPGTQDIAVLYDRDTTSVRLRKDIARRHRTRLKAETPAGRSAFPRQPIFAECTVGEGDEQVTFIFIVVHLKAFGDAQSKARRRLAAEKLAEIIDDIRDREGLPVVLGGDFNEKLDNDVLAAIKSSPDLVKMTADDAATDAISYVGASHRSLIDHMVVSSDAKIGSISGDDAAIVRLDRSVRDFADKVSDHVPVVFRMVLRDTPVDVDVPDDDSDVSEISEITADIPVEAKKVSISFEG
ncbi:MAG: trypsin-like peptidase domain-containing protein [Planctomycetaceae bacterium]